MSAVRESVLALVANVALGGVLFATLPYTLAESGERYRYYAMSLFFPIPECPSFHCFRILPPALASFLPLEVADAFRFLGLATLVLAGTMLRPLALALGASKRAAWWVILWFWATWGAILSLTDPLLITDPVQLLWSITALYLLVRHRFALALVTLVTGAAVKETVLLVPMIFALYALLARDRAALKPVWLALLIAAPMLTWLWIRVSLTSAFGYVMHEDESLLRATYFFGLWLPNLGPFPLNLAIAAIYIFGAFGAAWILGLAGIRSADPRIRALAIASVAPMIFLSLLQVPDRALASLPYAVLFPAAVVTARLPLALAAALIVLNFAFTVRMNTAVDWLPRMPLLLAALAALSAWAVYLDRAARGASIDRSQTSRADHPFYVVPPSALPRFWGDHVVRPVAYGTAVIAFVFLGMDRLIAWRGGLATTADLAGALPETTRVLDDGAGTPGMALSPDGRTLAMVLEHAAGRHVWLHDLETSSIRRLDATVGAAAPFWSSDGTHLGFFADGSLKTLELSSGAVRVLAPAPHPAGGTWRADGTILFAPREDDGLYLIPQFGGAATRVTTVDTAAGERSHRWPVVLPDQQHFLFVTDTSPADESVLKVGAFGGEASRVVAHRVSNAAYADPHLLVFAREGALWMQPFDVTRLQPMGREYVIAETVVVSHTRRRAAFAVAGDRLIVLRADTPREVTPSELRWVDRTGAVLQPVASPGCFTSVEASTDGRTIAIERAGEVEVLVDGRPVALADAPTAARHLRPRLPALQDARITHRTAAGEVIFQRQGLHRRGIWRGIPHALDTHEPLVDAPHDEFDGALSPDGRWIAYAANRNGLPEVFVEPVPADGRRWLVSRNGGAQPRWRQDGREILYVENDRALVAVGAAFSSGLSSGESHTLFTNDFPRRRPMDGRTWAMTGDASRFLVSTATEVPPPALQMISNWRNVLRVR